MDTNGDIIVADYDNRWVSIFSPEGKFKVRGLLSLHPWWPAEVTILEPPGGQDLDWPIPNLSCCFGARLRLLSPPGRIKSLMGIPSLQTKIGAGRLMGPKGVAVDRNGHIIVVDNKSCCVFTFQPNGKLVGRFGGRGATDRHFAGIAGQFRGLF